MDVLKLINADKTEVGEEIYRYANYLANGDGVDRDLEKAFSLFFVAATVFDHGESALSAAIYSEDGVRTKSDSIIAFYLYRKAASKKVREAIYSVGRCLTEGVGCERDEVRANDHYEEAAELGDSDAMYMIGYNNRHGIGCPVSEKKAILWLSKAASDPVSHLEAQFSLALCYLEGFGVAKNQLQGYRLLELAYAQGHKMAGMFLVCLDATEAKADSSRARDILSRFVDGGSKSRAV